MKKFRCPSENVGSAIIFRVDRKDSKQASSSFRIRNSLRKTILSEDMWRHWRRKREIDFSYGITDIARFRVNVPTNAVRFRLLDHFQRNSQCGKFADFPPSQKNWFNNHTDFSDGSNRQREKQSPFGGTGRLERNDEPTHHYLKRPHRILACALSKSLIEQREVDLILYHSKKVCKSAPRFRCHSCGGVA